MELTYLELCYESQLMQCDDSISILKKKNLSDPDIKKNLRKIQNRRYYLIRQLRKLNRERTWQEFNF